MYGIDTSSVYGTKNNSVVRLIRLLLLHIAVNPVCRYLLFTTDAVLSPVLLCTVHVSVYQYTTTIR